MRTEAKKLFVWDFHGTLEKGNEQAVVEISNLVLEKHGYPHRFTQEYADGFYGRKWAEYFAALLPDEAAERHLQLEQACLSVDEAGWDIIQRCIQPNDFASRVLSAISRSWHEQIVISNTRQDIIERFLRTVRMDGFFQNGMIFGTSHHLTGENLSKGQILERFLMDRNYQKIVAVGDSSSDVALAMNRGGAGYLYAHPGRPHREANATYKIDNLMTVLREIH